MSDPQVLPIQAAQSRGLIDVPPTGLTWSAPTGHAPQEDISVTAALGLLRRNWMLIVAVVGVSITAAHLMTRMTTPVFRASTTLYFADKQGSIPALDVLNQMENGNNQVPTEMEVMRSRALAGAVIDSLGMQARVILPAGSVSSLYFRVLRADPLAADAKFRFVASDSGKFAVTNAESGAQIGVATIGQPINLGNLTLELSPRAQSSNGFTVEVQPRSSAVDGLLARLAVTRPNRSASVVQISYTSEDPADTRNVPDALAATYLDWRSRLRKSGDRSTVEFLRRQIDSISTRLYSAEESLQHFREANQVVDLPTQAQTQVQRLAALDAQRADVDMQRSSLRSLMTVVKNAAPDPHLGSPYRRLMAFPGLMVVGNPAFSLLQTLTDLEQRRADLLVRRTVKDPDVESLNQTIGGIETQIAAVVDTYLKGLDEEATSLAQSVAQFHVQADKVPRREIEFARLDRNAKGLTEIYTMLQTRLREAQIAEAVDDGSVRVVDPATPPTKPIAPRPARNLLLGAVLGILMAFAVIMLRERLDHTVHIKEEIEAVAGAAVLAMIPHIGDADRARYFRQWLRSPRTPFRPTAHPGLRDAENGSRLLIKDTQSIASEAFRKLRTNITFARPASPPRVLVFTSPAAGDGKSTSVMNLAIALVQQGKTVIVVDGDMRRGGLHRLLNGKQTPGLSEILVGQADVDTAVQSLALESFGEVDMLATGVIPPNPAELLVSPRFRGLIDTLRTAYDVILIDSPPINLVTDAAIIGRETDGAIVVARAAKTTRSELAHAVSQLRQVQVAVTGMILNDYNPKRDAGYNSAAYYGYSREYRSYPNQG